MSFESPKKDGREFVRSPPTSPPTSPTRNGAKSGPSFSGTAAFNNSDGEALARARSPHIADIDRPRAARHNRLMRQFFRKIVFVSTLFTLACSNGQASSEAATRTPSENSEFLAAAVRLDGRVTDAAHVLSLQQQASLSDKLEKLEQSTKHQLVVATVPSLGGRDVAEFTRDLANAWGIGRKGYDDGVVLLVAPRERKVRIAVGHGLEKRLTNEICLQIIRQEILPRFRAGDLSGGVEAGTDALISQLE